MTSEKVPSPFLVSMRYSAQKREPTNLMQSVQPNITVNATWLTIHAQCLGLAPGKVFENLLMSWELKTEAPYQLVWLKKGERETSLIRPNSIRLKNLFVDFVSLLNLNMARAKVVTYELSSKKVAAERRSKSLKNNNFCFLQLTNSLAQSYERASERTSAR